VLRVVPIAYMPSPIPRQVGWNLFARTIPFASAFPRNRGGSAPASLFSGPAQRSLTLRPTRSPSRLSDPLHQRLQRSRCLHRCSDCYRVERTSSRAGIPPLWTSAFTAHPVCPSIVRKAPSPTVYNAAEFFLTAGFMSGDTMVDLSEPNFHPILTDSGNGPSFTMLGTTMRLIAKAADTGGRFTVGEQITPAGWGPPRHIHSREDEIFYILEGTYELHVSDERRTVSAGACAILPRDVPHGFRNVASTPGRLLFVITPGGLEEYFLAVAKCPPPPIPRNWPNWRDRSV
jgi:mannose-6-phosphate isomerase-like protein (cupin superfamily)